MNLVLTRYTKNPVRCEVLDLMVAQITHFNQNCEVNT